MFCVKEPREALEKVFRGERLGREEGVSLYRADLASLGMAASAMRRKMHPLNQVTFVMDRNIYCTNVCVAQCSFCAFSRDVLSEEAYVLTHEEILEKVRVAADAGGTQVLIQGGLNPELGLGYYVELVRKIKKMFPGIHVHSFSPPEIDMLAKREKMTYSEILSDLKNAGLNSLPGGGAEILVDRVRSRISPKKLSADAWIEVMRCAHGVGLKSTATMVFGHVETPEERISHLLRIRDLQDETGGFRAFICWTLSPRKTPGLHDLPMAGGWDYLRTVAIARLMLDNVLHIQSGWVTEGHRLAETALEFGANDMGGVLMEELVIQPTGIGFQTAAEDMVRLIRRSGYQPVQRDTNYAVVKEFDR